MLISSEWEESLTRKRMGSIYFWEEYTSGKLIFVGRKCKWEAFQLGSDEKWEVE